MKADGGVIGVVLAGGESRRMNRDKATLSVRGYATLMHQQVSLLKKLSLKRVVISRHQKHDTPADLVKDVIPDNNPNHHDGPLAGLLAVAKAFPSAAGLLVLPVDLPLMSVSLMSRLLEYGQTASQTAHFQDEYFPLFLNLGRRERDYLADQFDLATGNRSVHSLLHAIQAVEIEHSQPRAFMNTNTESEWEAAQTIRIEHG